MQLVEVFVGYNGHRVVDDFAYGHSYVHHHIIPNSRFREILQASLSGDTAEIHFGHPHSGGLTQFDDFPSGCKAHRSTLPGSVWYYTAAIPMLKRDEWLPLARKL